MSRTINSIKNIKFSMLGQVITLFSNFVTRMVFVRVLSAEYLGINGLFSNILSILSLAELGVGSALVYSMYKPLAERDETKLKGLMNLYKQAYIAIGVFVLLVGMLLTPFIEFFVKDMPEINDIRIIFIIYVINSGTSYFFSYKRSLLIADQKKYIESYYYYSFYFIRNLMQILLLLLTKNFIIYLLVQVIFTLIENVVISNKVDKLYPFLGKRTTIRLDRKEKSIILKNMKAMMLHKLGGVIVMGTDNLIISKFIGIVQVGVYSNYILIISALNQMFGMFFQSMTASIGNMGVTEESEKNIFIFSCIDLLGFWIYAFASICLFILFNPFINLWLGKDYLFSIPIVSLIVVSFYLTGRRQSVLTFKDALGLFWFDRLKPIFESGVNLVVSIILVQLLGIEGVIIGTIISTITTCFWIEPYVLYKHGFKSSVIMYFSKYITWTFMMILIGVVTWLLSSFFSDYTLQGFLLKLIICAIIPNLLLTLLFWRNKQFQYILSIFKNIRLNKNS